MTVYRRAVVWTVSVTCVTMWLSASHKLQCRMLLIVDLYCHPWATMNILTSIFERLTSHPTLDTLTLRTYVRFVRLINALRENILLAQPVRHHPTLPDQPPVFLSQSIILFLSHALTMSEKAVSKVWAVFKDIAWCREVGDGLSQDLESVFGVHGHQKGFSVCSYSLQLQYFSSSSKPLPSSIHQTLSASTLNVQTNFH